MNVFTTLLNNKDSRLVVKRILLTLLLLFGIGIRVEVASLGWNEDSTSNYLNSRIFLEGKSIYASTDRYNYGPVHFYIVGAIASVEEATGGSTFARLHEDIALFLALVDCGIFAVLYKMFGKVPAVLYILSPISILISGFHSQHDNVAIFLGLTGWLLYLKSQKVNSDKYYFGSALILGLSLVTKHIFYLFPLWVFFTKDDMGRKFPKRVLFLFLVYAVFAGGFALELLRHPQVINAAWGKIVQNVFQYKSVYGYSFFYKFIGLLAPIKLVEDAFLWAPAFKGFTSLYILMLTLYGLAVSRLRKDLTLFPLYYLAAFFALSPAVADQYVVIPLAVVCVFYFRLESVLYLLITVIYLYVSGDYNIGGLQDWPESVYTNLHVVGITLPFSFWNIQYKFSLISSQAYVFIFCLISLFTGKPIGASKFIGKILFLTITVLSLVYLLIFVWEKKIPEEAKIHILSATYGQSCGAKVGNKTEQESRRCGGLSKCVYEIGQPDPAPGCYKDYSITWSCARTWDKVFVSYRIYELKEAYGKVVNITCPVL